MIKEVDSTTKLVKVEFLGTTDTVVVGLGIVEPGKSYEVSSEFYKDHLEHTNLFKLAKTK